MCFAALGQEFGSNALEQDRRIIRQGMGMIGLFGHPLPQKTFWGLSSQLD